MKPLTIVHVSTQREFSGGEEQARLLADGLRQRGHCSVILARRTGAFARRMTAEGFDVLPIRGSGRLPSAIWQMRRELRQVGPHVVHCHDPHAVTSGGLAASIASVRARVASRKVVFPIRSAWRYRLFVDHVIATSGAVAAVCQAGGIEGEKITCVYDGVNPDRARSGSRARGRASLGIQPDQQLLLAVGSLSDCKGHKYLLDALPSVLASFPRAVLALAGDGELRARLQQQAERLGISGSVMFLGYRNNVPDLLKAADLMVLPSHTEALCSSLIDAMFARTPIVATTAGGIPEVLGSRGGQAPVGLLVPPRNAPALAGAILSGLADGTRLADVVDRAEVRALQLFTADRMVDETLAVYRKLLAA